MEGTRYMYIGWSKKKKFETWTPWLMETVFSQRFNVHISFLHFVSFLVSLGHNSESFSFCVYHLVVTITNKLLWLLQLKLCINSENVLKEAWRGGEGRGVGIENVMWNLRPPFFMGSCYCTCLKVTFTLSFYVGGPTPSHIMASSYCVQWRHVWCIIRNYKSRWKLHRIFS